jgi:hypothetical protein
MSGNSVHSMSTGWAHLIDSIMDCVCLRSKGSTDQLPVPAELQICTPAWQAGAQLLWDQPRAGTLLSTRLLSRKLGTETWISSTSPNLNKY